MTAWYTDPYTPYTTTARPQQSYHMENHCKWNSCHQMQYLSTNQPA